MKFETISDKNISEAVLIFFTGVRRFDFHKSDGFDPTQCVKRLKKILMRIGGLKSAPEGVWRTLFKVERK